MSTPDPTSQDTPESTPAPTSPRPTLRMSQGLRLEIDILESEIDATEEQSPEAEDAASEQ